MSDIIVTRVFEGIPIRKRRCDSYIDAIAACRACGKKFEVYHRLEYTHQYLEYIASDLKKSKGDLIISSLGTVWVHPRVALHLADWLRRDFLIWMDNWFLEDVSKKWEVLQLFLSQN
jgi:hypothetical protein